MRRVGGPRRSRGSNARPSRTWIEVSPNLTAGFPAVAATSAALLVSLQAPPTLVALTADPPEDLTILRLVGSFSLTLSITSIWTLGIIVQDTDWTPTAGVTGYSQDADKRFLWTRTFQAPDAQAYAWTPPGVLTAGANAPVPMNMETVTLDISPKVRVEAGKGLYAVAYEQAGAGTLTWASFNMRLLFQRSGRR